MKNWTLFICACLFFTSTYSQSLQWQWAKSDTSVSIPINPDYLRHVIAAANNGHSVWATLRNNKMPYSTAVLGNYKISEYDASGTLVQSVMMTGNFSMIQAQADNSGNWYFLGQYFDTVTFPGGSQFTRGSGSLESEYFVFKLNSSSLSVAWAKHVGASNNNTTQTFTIANNGLYIPLDSGASATHIYKLNLTSGDATLLWSQGGQSITSSIQVDESGNVYLAGSCAFTALNFNGHTIAGASTYPVYIVRYRSTGEYDWSYFMNDVTCNPRKLSLANNNTIFYSGAVHDTMSLDGYNLHHPAWVYDLMLTRLDSNGNILWLQQLKDTASGDANIEYPYHAAVTANGHLTIFAETRKTVDWGNNVVLNNPGNNNFATLINFAPDGKAQWVKTINADYASTQQIIAAGNNIWVSGCVIDTTALMLDLISVPAKLYSYSPYFAKINADSSGTYVSPVLNQPFINISPNPTSGIMYINGMQQLHEPVYIKITDLSGSVVYTRVFINASAREQINISSYARGLYFIELRTNTYKEVQKVILE